MESDENDGAKEVFAHFGLAYYLAGVFEAGLSLAILKLDFLTQQRRQAELNGAGAFNRDGFDAGYDTFLQSQQAKTLGNLLRRLRELIDIPADLASEFERAKQRRDFIAHHFFRERADQFASVQGRSAMIEELRADQVLFEQVDQRLTVLLEPHEAKIGISKEVLAKYIAVYLAGIPRDSGPA